ncbi:MAG: hypothetical protein C0417_02345 [Chlorobiaceae bacterium]|nr:hypothetical protein [Chlorobiaceae bacterium]
MKNEIKRRKFFGYILGGLAGGIFSANATSLIAKTKKIFKSEEKIVVKQNPLAVPRKKDEAR